MLACQADIRSSRDLFVALKIIVLSAVSGTIACRLVSRSFELTHEFLGVSASGNSRVTRRVFARENVRASPAPFICARTIFPWTGRRRLRIPVGAP